MKEIQVSIVIPNYNGREILEKSLPYVMAAFENKKNKVLEVIIVDDASVDESIKFIKSNYPKIKLVKHKVNRGFSSTVNTGFRTAKGNLIALLNSDVLPEEDFVEKCLV